MGVVEKFGQVVGSCAPTRPTLAAGILKTGWKAQLAALSFAPDRRLPPSRQYAAKVAMARILDAMDHAQSSAAVSAFAPSELVLAAGLKPFSIEQMSCFLAGSRTEDVFMQRASASGFPDTLCSYHRVYLGALESGLMPAPACVIYTNVACDGNMLTFPHVAQAKKSPSFCVDVPYERSEESVHWVVRQLEELVGFLEEVTGSPFDQDALAQHVRRAWISALEYRRFLDSSPGRFLAGNMVTEMYAFLLNHVLLGSEETERFARQLARDMADAPTGDGLRLVWLHTMPFSQEPAIDRIDFTNDAFIVASDLAADPMLIDIDPDRPLEAIARRLVYSCYNGPAQVRVERALDLASRTMADGVLLFNHWGCKATIGSSFLIKEELEKRGLPCLVLDGDGIDARNRSDDQLATRMDAFFEMLRAKR